MVADLLKDQQFRELEKEYKFLSRARGESIDNLECVILDVETTGLYPTEHELTEIAGIKIKGTEIINIFSSLIKPHHPIPQKITELTGIDDEMVRDFPPAEIILPKFVEFIEDSILIAHNAEFDLSFIKYHLKKLANQELNNSIVCTVKIARYLLPGIENHKLHSVGKHFDLPIQNRHRAMGDCELTFGIWQKFIPLLKEKGIKNKQDLDSLMRQL
ncbi:MAG: hypothetical protein HQ596_01530 [Candidatus Saganbacteria bacterium]|nr:hypothetical protein [Candidatus Saganbacteria bacterium]